MKALKIIGITLLIIFFITLLLFSLYFLFANEAYGLDMLKELFSEGVFSGIKNFFIDIWKGIIFIFS